MEKWLKIAKECGFTEAAPLDPSTLKTMPMVRDSCREDKCKAYNKNWTCPPNCGTLEECEEKMHSYSNGILLQTVGELSRRIDSKAYMKYGMEHQEALHKFAERIREEYPSALCLGAGGCQICKTCAYPEPCRFPEKAMSSMEGYGLFVTQVCRDNNVKYYYGPKTIAYSACVLF